MIHIIGHRGSPLYARENTVGSFKKAFELGADAVECDIRLTKDGYPVVIHDEVVDRVSDGSGFVSDLTLGELKRLRFGCESIPTMEEVLDLLEDNQKYVLLEIKERGSERGIMERVYGLGYQKRVVYISFWHDVVSNIKFTDASLQTGIIFKGMPVDVAPLIESAKADRIHVNYPYIDKNMVDASHRMGVGVTAWLNHPRNARKIADFGVDALVTDYPDFTRFSLEGAEYTMPDTYRCGSS